MEGTGYLSPMSAPLVELRGIRKVFPGVVANDGVDFELRAGEIHALLGENGAGKSTLMSVLMGLYRPDGGCIRVRGEERHLRSPRDAIGLGLGMVHQHFVQSERHTALENITLGHPRMPFFPRMDALRAGVQQAAARHGLQVDLDAPIRSLPVGERQKVEILRALHHGASILILDEPTAVLSRQESAALFEVLRRFAAEGGAVVFISHKLDEVLAIADRVTVLRRGASVCTCGTAGLDAAALASLMVGRELELQRREPGGALGAEVARLEGVEVLDPRGVPSLDRVSLSLRAGEVVGIAGVSGSGQGVLAELLAGLIRPTGGRLLLFGQDPPHGPRAFRDLGVAHIPADRNRMGVAGALSVAENLILESYAARFGRWGMLRWGPARRWAGERVRAHDIQCPSLDAHTASLSGGNVQKVILARELAVRRPGEGWPRLVVAAYPCRGLDVGAAEAIRARLLEASGAGAAVLLISEDLDELLRLADRIGVLFRGRLLGPLPVAELSREGLGLMMGGHRGPVAGDREVSP